MSNILLVIQARAESARLPNKVLLPMCGQPMLLWQLARLASFAYPVVVAAPDTPANAPLHDLCVTHGYTCHLAPGDPNDVLDRFAKVVALYPDAQHIVRLTGDTPLLDPHVVNALINRHVPRFRERCTYENNQILKQHYTGLAREWGDGNDCEIFTRDALLGAHAEATEPHEREHVGPFVWGQPHRFTLSHLPCRFDLSWMRTSVDTKEDFLHVQMLLDICLSKYGLMFSWRDVWYVASTNETLRSYMHARPMNEAYVEQVGGETWDDVRYGVPVPEEA